MAGKRTGKFYRQNEADVMKRLGLKPTKKKKGGNVVGKRKGNYGHAIDEETRKRIFIWEHEINDDWFWIGDFIEEVM